VASTSAASGHYLHSDSFKGDAKKLGLHLSNSVQVLGPSKQQSIIEHGAVAAVIPSINSSTVLSGSKGGQSMRSAQSQQQQQFLPTIQSTGSASASNQSQAMYAATSVSPYHSVEEGQQNIPNLPNGSHLNLQLLSSQTPSSDYFNLK